MTWASSVPDTIAGLVAALQGSAVLDGVLVLDGPVVTASSAQEVITVGYTGDEDEDAAEVAYGPQGLSTARSRETYRIRCAASVRNGSGDMAAARGRAYELLAYAGQTLAADKTLGGAAMKAVLGSAALRQAQDAKGAVATVIFEVAVDAFTKE